LGNKHELEAGNLFFRASTFGYDPAEVNLGSAYLRGFGVDQNFKLARYWFEKAGQTPRAQELLGILSLLGLGAEQDMEAAFEYFKQASGLGQQRVSQLSYSQLAVLSEMGVGDFHDEFYDRWRQQLSSLGEASTLNSIVWALSTNPIPELNRPEIALELARRLQKNTEEPAYLDSVAAALAINGEFKEASKIQKKVIAALTGTREYQEAKRRYQGYKRKRAWVEDYKQDKPSRHKETSRTVAVVTGEIIRSDEQRPETAPAFRIGAQPEWVVPVLVKEVVEGSLPYTMKEYAYFVLSGVSAFSEDCGDPIPEGINTFTLTERLSSDGWQYEFAMDCPR
jgi:hypothetical protein